MKSVLFGVVALYSLALFSCSENKVIKEEPQAESIEMQIKKAHEIFLSVAASNPNAVLRLSMDGNKLVSKIEVLKDNAY